ncbi:hypothetical protein [Dolichospermum heterosporum]|nr:hypothetical protein [Dolichospermum heterosporum]
MALTLAKTLKLSAAYDSHYLVPQGGSQKSKVKSQNEDSIGFWRI